MWWDLQTEEKQNQVRELVKNGQLEIVNAGWSMHDEACPTYTDMINNMMRGQQWVLEHVGVAPKIGWQIDPFGHSNANARLFHDMGFNAMFFGRMDSYEDGQRANNKEKEWIQRPAASSMGTDAQLLFHMNTHIYTDPPGMAWDITTNDEPFEDDETLDTYNAPDYAKKFIDFMEREQNNIWATDHEFIYFGMDFRYMDAFVNYRSLDRFIKYMNENHGDEYHLQYTTPSDYVQAINDLNHTWPVKYDDLFPYQDQDQSWWVGYFSSRANAKAQVRHGSSNFHSSQKMAFEVLLDQDMCPMMQKKVIEASTYMQNELGVYQHHDAVSGTAKQAVADDYTYRLSKAMTENK